MLITRSVSVYFWPFALATACHIKNRLPSSSLPAHTTPHERWTGSQPDVSYFQEFGVHCYARVVSDSLKKLDDRGEFGIFLGYA
ncbi:hypothetical protein SISNIDRAFT_397724, partial [Sistotremastrum niveocremeum HHB9708]